MTRTRLKNGHEKILKKVVSSNIGGGLLHKVEEGLGGKFETKK